MNASRERMLANIRASLNTTRATLDVEATRMPHTAPPFVHRPEDDLVAQFAAEFAKLEGQTHRCADEASALGVIADILRAHHAPSVIAWEHDKIGLPGLDELFAECGVVALDPHIVATDRKERLQMLEPAPVCISGADVGIAESGSLLIAHGDGKPRIASLLAPIHIAVLRASQLVRGLGEAIAQVRQERGADLFADASNITLITGPSRTADIEMTLTLGIHGPREMHVVLIEK